VNSIHSACAAAFARHRGKTGTLHLLQEEIYRIEKGIEGVRRYCIFRNSQNRYEKLKVSLFTVFLLNLNT